MHQSGDNGKKRCFGNRPGQHLYAAYHDCEWGVPQRCDRRLFEMLVLEGAQAGLSWETILNKREGYRRVFHHFAVEKVALLTDAELEDILLDPGIVRNRLKVWSARQNARVFMEIQKEMGSFHTYLWSYVGNTQIVNLWETLKDVPVKTPVSDAISKDLVKRGMKFVGSTIIYAYMQAIGLVDDHLTNCWKRQN